MAGRSLVLLLALCAVLMGAQAYTCVTFNPLTRSCDSASDARAEFEPTTGGSGTNNNNMYIKSATCRITDLPSDLQTTVNALFPEGQHPPNVMTRPDIYVFVTQANTNISFTFVSTGAGNQNRLGYATFNQATNSLVGSARMAFPRLNTNNGVGCLRAGDTYKFGQFAKDDMVIFFLDSNSLSSSRYWSYVNDQFYNPDREKCGCTTGYIHGSWAYLSDNDITLFGFEDLELGDADYNDVMFFLSFEGGLTYNEVPPYENGTLKICNFATTVTDKSYAVSNCTQWGILEATAAQSCLTYMSIPSGWVWASAEDPSAVAIINQLANSQWSYTEATCFLLSTNATHGIGYSSSGALCDPENYSIQTLYNATSQMYCYNAACSSRFVLRGADLGAACSATSICSPTVSGAILPGGTVPVSAAGVYQYPTSNSVYLRTANGVLDLTTSLQVGVSQNNARKLDVFVIFDGTTIASNKRDEAADSFAGVLNDLNNRGVSAQLGFALYRPSLHTGTNPGTGFSSSWTLTTSTSTINTWASSIENGAYDSSCPSSNSGKHHAAVAYAMEAARGINWRSDAYHVIWIVTVCGASTTDSPLAAAVRNTAIQVVYSTPTSTYGSGWDDGSSYTPLGFIRWKAASGNNGWRDEVFRSNDSPRGAYAIVPFVSKARGYVLSDAQNFVTGMSSSFNDISSNGIYNLDYQVRWPSGFTANQGVASYSAVIGILGRSFTSLTINFNHSPLISNVAFPVTAGENRTITFSPSDPDGNLLTMTVVTVPNVAVGSLYRVDNGNLITANTQLPAGTYSMILATVKTNSGVASWTVSVNDGCVSTTAAATITVNPSNSAPRATSFGISMDEDSLPTGLNGQIDFAPHISDVDNPAAAQTLTVYLTSLPASRGNLNSWNPSGAGSIINTLSSVANLTRFVLGTNAGYGTVTFNYRVSDGSLFSEPATVTITINPINHRPVLVIPVRNYNVFVDEDGDQPIAATITDTDGPRGDTVNLFITATTFSAATPLEVATGDVTFADPYAVSPVVKMFTAYYGSATTSFPVTGLIWRRHGATGSGTVTFVARDLAGLESDPVTVTFGVTEYNPPTWTDTPDATRTIDQGETLSTGLAFAATDIDYAPEIDWNRLIFTLTAKSAQATISVQHTSGGAALPLLAGTSFSAETQANYVTLIGGTTNTSGFSLIYTPDDAFHGTDQFTFTVHDPNDLYAEAVTVEVVVNRANTKPISTDSVIRGLENTLASTDIALSSTNDAANNEVLLRLKTSSFPGVLYLGPGATNPWTINGNTTTVVSPPGTVKIYARGNFGVFSDPSTDPVGTFTYEVIEPETADNNVGDTYTGRIFLEHVNHPPTSSDQYHTVKKRELLQVTLPASDPDADDTTNTLTASITSIAFSSKGEFYTDAAMGTRIDNAFISAGGLLTARTFWYISMTDHSTSNQPLATYTFIVTDKQNLASTTNYNGRIVVNFAGDPPTFGGDDSVTTNQETPVPMVLAIGSLTESGAAPVVRVLDLPQKGAFSACDNNGICTPVTSVPNDGLVLTSDAGRVVFLPEKYNWDQNYTKFHFSLTDPLSGASGLYTMYIHVIHVNKRPFIEAMNFLTTAETNQGIIVNESTSLAFSWRAYDQDSLPSVLQTSLRVSFYTTQGFTLYQCTGNAADWLSTAACTFDPSVPFAVRSDFTKNAKQTINSYSTVTTACATFTDLRALMGNFSRDCETHFKFNFVPTPGASYTPYISINFIAIDDEEAESSSISATIWVKAVNTPPTISSPPVVLGTQGITNPFIRNTDQNSDQYNNPVIVFDEDHNGNLELLTISVNSGFSGNLIYPETAPCSVDPNNNQVWYCLDRILSFNKWLGDLRFEVTSGDQADLTFTINDLGHTSDWKPSANLTATSQTTIKVTAAVTAPTGNSSTLAIAVGVAAAVGLLLLGALGFFLRKAVAPPKDDYFSAATTPLSAAPQSPLYQAQNQTHENALYKARS